MLSSELLMYAYSNSYAQILYDLLYAIMRCSANKLVHLQTAGLASSGDGAWKTSSARVVSSRGRGALPALLGSTGD